MLSKCYSFTFTPTLIKILEIWTVGMVYELVRNHRILLMVVLYFKIHTVNWKLIYGP